MLLILLGCRCWWPYSRLARLEAPAIVPLVDRKHGTLGDMLSVRLACR